MLHRIPSIVQRQLKIQVVRRRSFSPLPRDLPRVSLDDRAIALPLKFAHVVGDAWLARSGVFAFVGVDAFLPGAWEPPPEYYEADGDEAGEDAYWDCPDWCHCCCLCGLSVACLGSMLLPVERKAGSGVWCGAESWGCGN